MSITRSLLNRQITYSEAQREETINVLQELTYVASARSFRYYIVKKREAIKIIVAHHLHLPQSSCHIDISDCSEWINGGSFNLCVPVSIQYLNKKAIRRVLMRFPLPYKVGGTKNGDEKIRCEAATYAWLNRECPDIPTACLQGFGLSMGQRNTGKMLSQSYAEQSHSATLRRNLFSDLARIQLTLSQKPFPRIGSLTIDDDSIIRLNNRPFTLEICQLENYKIPCEISRRTTYPTVDTYVHDLLSLHDNRLRYQANGASSMQDCISQMSALATMRTIYPDFFRRKLRSGPFVLTLTDMHTSNFFVDDDWHITKLVDLEWACVRPIEMQHPPYWLTSQAEEEKKMAKEIGPFNIAEENLSYSGLLEKLWKEGTFWYCFALDSLTGLHHIFYNRIRPRYQTPYTGSKEFKFDDAFYIAAPTFWDTKAWNVMLSKAEDKEKYDKELLDALQTQVC
ncbi:hypothetical protein AJ79_03863 [Helicocarpus griseus UAMH5409]|uniref:Aminoglycoside phosphotransferase domain-containing protein n=1 Tax=Helicocarpus griseus UAMH5409 TaxID=1447875 RepID=A0A2B7XVB9_9EURO|nr:hypothetical protein AJ79_03863 [Helicocarpus griseus UAMH5409]